MGAGLNSCILDMDRLSEDDQRQIRKMSTDRLIAKLSKAGVSEDEMETMDRAAKMERWAQVVAQGESDTLAGFGGGEETARVTDIQWEKEKMMMMLTIEREKMALEREKLADNEIQRRHEMDKLEKEQSSIMERDDSRIEIERRRLKLQEEKENSRASQLKRYGDAMRNSMSRMGENSPVDFLQFISNLERVFISLEVPDDLKVELMTPYLSESCRLLLCRLRGPEANSYKQVKRFLTEQLRLVPSYFVDEFNYVKKLVNETFKSYISRLWLLLSYYLDSRCVNTLEMLIQLLVCDRVKASLSPPALTHLLRCETTLKNQWANTDELADILDTYYSTHDKFDRPRASALGASVPVREGQIGQGNKTTPKNFDVGRPQVHSIDQKSVSNAPSVYRNSQQMPRSRWNDIGGLRCFKCGKLGHRRAQCQSKSSAVANKCSMSVEEDISPLFQQSSERENTRTLMHDSEPEVGDSTPVVSCDKVDVHRPMELPKQTTLSKVHAAVALADLNYVNVSVRGIDHTIKTLLDTGSQINCVHPKICEALNLTPIGKIKIRGIFGEAAPADLVKIQVRLQSLPHGDDWNKNENDFLSIICASCPSLNETLVLTLPVYEQLCNFRNESVERQKDDDKTTSLSDVTVAVTTRSQSKLAAANQQNNTALSLPTSDTDSVHAKCDSVERSFLDVDDLSSLQTEFDNVGCETLKHEQRTDPSLSRAFALARDNKAGYFLKNDLLFHKEKLFDREFINLVVPTCRRQQVLSMAHDTCHFSGKTTYERIISSGLTWRPTSSCSSSVRSDAIYYAATCAVCQKHARVTCFDRVPIQAVPREITVFRHMQMDVFGEILPGEKLRFNYALIIICSASRYELQQRKTFAIV